MTTLNTCYTCVSGKSENLEVHLDGDEKLTTVNVQLNDGEIPSWFKIAGIYSPLAPFITCDTRYNWFVRQGLIEITPNNFTNAITFKLNELVKILDITTVDPYDTYLAYWGTSMRDYKDPTIPNAITAYRDFSNSGLVKSNPRDSAVTIFYQNPSIYQVGKEVWPPHLHFTLLQGDKTWFLSPGAIDIFPRISTTQLLQFIADKTVVIVNSILTDTPETTNIPGSIVIPDTSNPKHIRQTFDQYLEGKLLGKLIKNGIPKKTQIPICVYCKNRKCGSALKLIHKLRKMGYTNLMYYPGGWELFFSTR